MSKKIQIFKSDSEEKRRAKRSFRRKLNSKLKKHKNTPSRKKRKREGKLSKKKSEYIHSPIKYHKEIQHFCDANNIEDWKHHPQKIYLTENFSLYKDPNAVLASLLNILYLAKTKSKFAELIYKGHANFGALYFIDAVCHQIGAHRKWILKHSNLPKKEQNILKNLKSINAGVTDSEDAYIINKLVWINRSADLLAKQKHKELSKEIRDLIIKGIKENHDPNYELTHFEHTAIDSAISEHFDNILLHVPNAEYGCLCGFFDKKKKEVTILIYNFGHTIAYTLSQDNLPAHIQNAVNEVIKNYSKKFLLIGNSYTKENALTLLSIQEGISSKLDADESRGHGLIDFIEHCKELNPNSKIVIISGKTFIRIDSDYKIGQKDVFGRKRRILAFNKDNDIFEKPNDKNVVNLSVNFPDVIIKTTISLDNI